MSSMMLGTMYTTVLFQAPTTAPGTLYVGGLSFSQKNESMDGRTNEVSA